MGQELNRRSETTVERLDSCCSYFWTLHQQSAPAPNPPSKIASNESREIKNIPLGPPSKGELCITAFIDKCAAIWVKPKRLVSLIATRGVAINSPFEGGRPAGPRGMLRFVGMYLHFSRPRDAGEGENLLQFKLVQDQGNSSRILNPPVGSERWKDIVSLSAVKLTGAPLPRSRTSLTGNARSAIRTLA